MVDVPNPRACAFCSYLEGGRPYVFLWREPNVVVAVTREQRGISHLLILPVVHTPTLLELDTRTAESLMLALRDAAITIDRADQRPGIAVWQNNGIAARQTIGHLHFHVAGTLPDGGTEFGTVEEISLGAAAHIAKRLRGHVPTESRAPRTFPEL